MKTLTLKPSSVLTELPYKPVANVDGSVSFLLGETDPENNKYSLFIFAKPPVSPMQYPIETFELITSFLSLFSISTDNVKIYLDYAHFQQKKSPSLSQWHFTYYLDEYQNDSLSNVSADDLSESEKALLAKYNMN